MKTLVAFGEIMARMAAPDYLRLRQTRSFDVTYAGCEASVAASICNYGGQARFVTALPKHELADATVDSLRAIGVDTRYILRTDQGRLGLYFLETGANQRPSNVIYDRVDSAVSITPGHMYHWDAILDGADWLHLSGITPALSKIAADTTVMAAQKAKAAGVSVCLDLNFRNKLWSWDPRWSNKDLAYKTLKSFMPSVDLLIGNAVHCYEVLGAKVKNPPSGTWAMDHKRDLDVAKQVTQMYPNVSMVAFTLRESESATHNNWGAMMYDKMADQVYKAPVDGNGNYKPYQIKYIVDRVGTGDAFAGGLLFALMSDKLSTPQTALRFAAAASCLKHSILGDFNYSSRSEIEDLMDGDGHGRVKR